MHVHLHLQTNYDPSVLTVPQSPHFESDNRAARRPQPKSSEEIEVEYMKQHAWTANPVNVAALESTGDLGVPRIAKKALTTTEEFHLSTSARPAAKEPEPIVTTFKAREVDKRILQSVQFQPQPSSKQLTETASPHLRTRERAASKEAPQPETFNTDFKARPVPATVRQKPAPPPRPPSVDVTECEEFQLESIRRHEQYQCVACVGCVGVLRVCLRVSGGCVEAWGSLWSPC